MTHRIFATLALCLLSASTLLAQAEPEPVNSPQRGTTYADNGETWFNQPFVWMGLGIIVLIVVLLMLRRKNAPTVGRKHHH